MGKIRSINRQPHTLKQVFILLLTVLLVTRQSYAIDNQTAEIAPEVAGIIKAVDVVESKQWMAVTANDYATKAAAEILSQGGSAVDAAIAAQLVLGLVEPQSSGIGGGAFLVYWNQQTRQVTSFDGRETAPRDVDEDHFLSRKGKPMAFYDAVIGGHAVGTPGLLHMLDASHKRFGRLEWPVLFQPAIKLAEQGFIVSPRLNLLLHKLKESSKNIHDTELGAYLFDAKGKPRPVGYPLKNQAYANTLKKIANGGAKVFYEGEIAEDIVRAVRENPVRTGKLSLADLKNYRSKERQALCKDVGEYRLCGAPPPSSGASTVIEILAILNELPGYKGLAYNSPAFYHRLSEASRLAFADRNRYLADPDFVKVPIEELMGNSFLKNRARLVPLRVASKEAAEAGTFDSVPDRQDSRSFELPSTTHLSIIDAEGNIASMTSSIETAFGSRVMVNGFLLNNQLTDFSFSPVDKDNHKIANRIEAKKRPRSSMAPMVVLDQESKPVLAIGSPGGSRIIDYVAKVIAQHLYLGVSLETAIHSAHVVNLNNQRTEIEKGHQDSQHISQALTTIGHTVKPAPQTSGIHAIAIKPGGYQGVADPRREGSATGE